MNLNERDNHLDELFCIQKPDDLKDVEVVEESEENLPDNPKEEESEYRRELRKNINRMNQLYIQSEKVLNSAKDQAISFSTPRDVEVYAKLLDSMVNVQKETSNVLEKMYSKKENGNNKDGGITQNNIYVGDIRKLNDLIDQNK